jgi:hypothetical protein
MAQIHKSAATLRIRGDDLIPAEISRLLTCAPTTSQRKGDAIVGKRTSTKRIARTGMWSLHSEDQEPEDLDRQIEEILARLTADIESWQTLARTCRMDLFGGLFMQGANEGLEISTTSLVALGRRGISLALDIYGPEREEVEEV